MKDQVRDYAILDSRVAVDRIHLSIGLGRLRALG